MKNLNRIVFVVSFIALVGLIIAFTSIYPFVNVEYGWQCATCGFFGFLWIASILIEIWKQESQ